MIDEFYKRYYSWKEVFLFSLLTSIGMAAIYFVPQINRFVIDEIAINKKLINIPMAILITVVCLSVIHLYLLFFPNFFASINQCRVERKIRKDLVKKYLSMPNYEYLKFDKAFLLNLFFSDSYSATATLITLRVAKINSIIQFSVFCIIVLFTNWKLALTSLIFIPLYFIAIMLSRKNLHTLSKQSQKKNDDCVAITNSIINGKPQITIVNAEKFFIEKQNLIQENYFSARLKSEFFFVLLQRIPSFVQAVTPLIILILGANLVRQDEITVGTLVMFVQYVGMMFEPIEGLAQLLAFKNQNTPAFERLSKVLFANHNVKCLPMTKGNTRKSRISNIDVYTNANELLFSIDDLDFNETGIYCIKGENGAGKTTFINLLCALYDPTCFKLQSEYSVFEISENFNSKSYLYHPHFFFEGTVKDNILLGEKFSDQQLRELCNVFNFEKFLDKEVKTNPINLSDGEQQKLCLIRVLIRNKKTIILDEPEKSLDSISIQNLRTLIVKLKQDHLILIITHTSTFDQDAAAVWEIKNKKMQCKQLKHEDMTESI